MDLAELNVFLTVARERSFSRAAQKLYRTQPAVSIAIRKLEEWVGEPLFARGARSGQLTDAGQLLVGYAERMLNLREEIKRAMEDLRSGGRGELSLGVNESSIHALLPVLARYRQLYPDVHLAVRRTFSRDIPSELLNYRLDLGVASFVPQEPQLAAVKIFRDELAFVVSPAPPPRQARPRGHRRTRRGSLRRPHRRIALPQPRHSTLRQAPRAARNAHRAAHHRKHQALRADGYGRGHRAAHVRALGRSSKGLLVEVKVRQLRMPRDLYLLYRRRGPLSHAATAMLRLLRPGAVALPAEPEPAPAPSA